MTQLLLGNSANIHAVDKYRDTSLYQTVRQNLGIIKLLFENKADLHVKNNSAESPLTLASKLNSPEIMNIIEQYQTKFAGAIDHNHADII